MRKIVHVRWLYTMMISLLAFSCSKDEVAPGPIASFQFEADPDNFLKINFSNFSQNVDSFTWDFGDGSTTSTEKDPSHTYEATGTYSVTLTATGSQGTSTKTQDVLVIDPDEALTLLAGVTSKTWKLYRVGNAFGVGPNASNPYQYYALTNNGTRNCYYNQTFTFTRSGQYIFDDEGEFWGEFGVFDGKPNFETCFPALAANMVNKDNIDVSKWLSGTHAYTYNATSGELTLTGLGAWIGVPKLGTSSESSVPVSEVKTKITLTKETGFDLMRVVFDYGSLYWEINYASYEDPADEPGLDPNPIAGFTYVQDALNKKMFTFTNTSNSNGKTFSWNFGDGTAAVTTKDAVHTYANNGTYTVTLTAYNGLLEDSKSETITTLVCTPESSTDVTNPATGLNITWATAGQAHFGQFGNIGSSRVSNPFIDANNSSCFVFKYEKLNGCETWSGMSFLTGATFNFTSQNGVFRMKAYGVNQGTTVKMRFEKSPFPDTEPSVERTATLTGSGAWQTLTFDFRTDVSNNNYTVMLIYFEQGAVCDGDVYFFDDLIQSAN